METTKHSHPSEANRSNRERSTGAPAPCRSTFSMVDVGPKTATARRATAQGKILLSREAYEALVNGTNPKGDVLSVAEVAGIQAAKRTSEWIPLCHPLPLDQVKIEFQLLPSECAVLAFCQAATTAKTGVEMEALCGVNAALLSIYDLSKAVNPVLTISDIRLNLKEGGKSGTWRHPDFAEASVAEAQVVDLPLEAIRVGVLTISDRCARGEATDHSGPELAALCGKAGATLVSTSIVSDQVAEIQRAVLKLVRDEGVALVLTTGGTGLSPRDVTPEALDSLWTKKIPGIGELLRAEGSRHVATSWLSRSGAGIIDRSLVVYLPGSLRAVHEGWATLESLLPHALHIANGGGH
ncbi:MAG: bifunctional molybdenum cofactor biosynthesis protein MoaC/MoaB [Deltaproteobacteria bacterium]|nr:bifunctional molybdenum cofactor biosynthesis protein MoaC/MoaB [Deltaproteobacteria bacterium]